MKFNLPIENYEKEEFKHEMIEIPKIELYAFKFLNGKRPLLYMTIYKKINNNNINIKLFKNYIVNFFKIDNEYYIEYKPKNGMPIKSENIGEIYPKSMIIKYQTMDDGRYESFKEIIKTFLLNKSIVLDKNNKKCTYNYGDCIEKILRDIELYSFITIEDIIFPTIDITIKELRLALVYYSEKSFKKSKDIYYIEVYSYLNYGFDLHIRHYCEDNTIYNSNNIFLNQILQLQLSLKLKGRRDESIFFYTSKYRTTIPKEILRIKNVDTEQKIHLLVVKEGVNGISQFKQEIPDLNIIYNYDTLLTQKMTIEKDVKINLTIFTPSAITDIKRKIDNFLKEYNKYTKKINHINDLNAKVILSSIIQELSNDPDIKSNAYNFNVDIIKPTLNLNLDNQFIPNVIKIINNNKFLYKFITDIYLAIRLDNKEESYKLLESLFAYDIIKRDIEDEEKSNYENFIVEILKYDKDKFLLSEWVKVRYFAYSNIHSHEETMRVIKGELFEYITHHNIKFQGYIQEITDIDVIFIVLDDNHSIPNMLKKIQSPALLILNLLNIKNNNNNLEKVKNYYEISEALVDTGKIFSKNKILNFLSKTIQNTAIPISVISSVIDFEKSADFYREGNKTSGNLMLMSYGLGMVTPALIVLGSLTPGVNLLLGITIATLEISASFLAKDIITLDISNSYFGPDYNKNQDKFNLLNQKYTDYNKEIYSNNKYRFWYNDINTQIGFLRRYFNEYKIDGFFKNEEFEENKNVQVHIEFKLKIKNPMIYIELSDKKLGFLSCGFIYKNNNSFAKVHIFKSNVNIIGKILKCPKIIKSINDSIISIDITISNIRTTKLIEGYISIVHEDFDNKPPNLEKFYSSIKKTSIIIKEKKS